MNPSNNNNNNGNAPQQHHYDEQKDGNTEAPPPMPPPPPAASGPEWRAVTMGSPTSSGFVGGPGDYLRTPLRSASAPSSVDVIDKSSYFSAAVRQVDDYSTKTKPYRSVSSDDVMSGGDNSSHCWSPARLRPIPAFYPLERSSRFVEDDLETVVGRVLEANRMLSVHAVYCDETPTASLLTSENVEMHLSLWKPTAGTAAAAGGRGGQKRKGGIVVEIQRRKGDSIAFHRYSRCILDAAAGELDVRELVETNGEDFMDAVYNNNSKKMKKAAAHRVLCMGSPKDAGAETENAVVALEIAHGLLTKDRIDARRLGLESLCLLTDPAKTGLVTASMASRVVLLGTARDDNDGAALACDEAPFREIREILFSLIQFRRIGDADEFDGVSLEGSEEEEHITVLHNLALGVLANALDVIENEESSEPSPSSSPEEVRGLPPRLEAFESISEKFLEDARECSENREMMKTLIGELGEAGSKPHNACLSAKCIGSLCRASEKARRRANDLGAKTAVQTALDVGSRTHLKLERECDKVLETLSSAQSNEESLE